MDAELCKRMREQTHCGLNECKTAWIAVGYDYDKAVEYLRTIGTTAHVNPIFTRLDALEASQKRAYDLLGVMFHNDVETETKHLLEVGELEAKCNGLIADCSFLREENGKLEARVTEREAQRDILWADRKALREQIILKNKTISNWVDQSATHREELKELEAQGFQQAKKINLQAYQITALQEKCGLKGNDIVESRNTFLHDLTETNKTLHDKINELMATRKRQAEAEVKLEIKLHNTSNDVKRLADKLQALRENQDCCPKCQDSMWYVCECRKDSDVVKSRSNLTETNKELNDRITELNKVVFTQDRLLERQAERIEGLNAEAGRSGQK